jgi:Putative DNA-binding domain
MLPFNLEDTTCADIQGLIDAEVPEGLRLEYKSELPLDSSDGRRRFLYQVAAMANADGGELIFGILDRKGSDNQNTSIADKLSGMKIANVGKITEALSNLIRNGIAPRLTGFAIKAVNSPNGDVLVVRTLPSWNKPHMVTIEGVDRFYIRTPVGKSPMSVDEIGRAFSQQGEVREAIERWRTYRAELISQDKGPAQLSAGVACLFHLIPAEAFTRGILRESWRVPPEEQRSVYVPCGNYNQRYNADGFLCLSGSGVILPGQSRPYAYTQLFRSGIIEYAFCNFFQPPMGIPNPMIWGQALEKEIVRCYQDALTRFRTRDRSEVVFAGFSLLGIKGKNFYISAMSYSSRDDSIRQDIFTSPEILVDINEPEDLPFPNTLLPLVDTMWQVGGREGTPFHGKDGAWNPFGEYQ